MNKQALTAHRAKELLHYNEISGVLTRKVSLSRSVKVGDIAGTIHPVKKYIYLYVDGKKYFAHRVVWLMFHGSFPEKQIDHINGNRQDNRIQNLREVDGIVNAQNKRNPKSGNTSGLLGVSWMSGANKWRAQIKSRDKVIYLGIFDDKNEAHLAYLNAKRVIHSGCTI